jgi:hypothetical protein
MKAGRSVIANVDDDVRERAAKRRDVLLAELYELEDEAYRRSFAHAERVARRSTPSDRGAGALPALRAAIGHASGSLDELRVIVLSRKVRTKSFGTLVFDALRGLVDRLDAAPDADPTAEGRLAVIALERPASVVRLVRAAAVDCADEGVVRWCDGWLRARLELTRSATLELERLARRRERDARARRHVRLAPAA